MKCPYNYDLRQFPAKIDLSLESLICFGKIYKRPFLTLTVSLSRHSITKLPTDNNMTREINEFKTGEP